MAGLCQDCTGCCTVFEVKDIAKPFGVPCQYLGRTLFGVGCQIYDARPGPCQRYICLWLDSQRRAEVAPLAENLKPEECKVVLGWPWGEDRTTLFVYPYPGYEDNWRVPPVSEHLKLVLSRGGKVVVVIDKRRIAIHGDMAVIGTEDEFAELLK